MSDYLVFDGTSNQLVTVNFLSPHGPGVMDHSTANVRRLVGIPFSTAAAAAVSVAVDLSREVAYVADGSADRVLAVDYKTGDCARSARTGKQWCLSASLLLCCLLLALSAVADVRSKELKISRLFL